MPSEVIMLKAKVLPMLMRERTTARPKMVRTEFTGTSYPGRTAVAQDEKGSARSRAKAKSWRLDPAIMVMQVKKERMMTMEVIALVAAKDPVAW